MISYIGYESKIIPLFFPKDNGTVKKISLNFKYSYLILAKDNVLKKNSCGDLKKTMFAEFNKIR